MPDRERGAQEARSAGEQRIQDLKAELPKARAEYERALGIDRNCSRVLRCCSLKAALQYWLRALARDGRHLSASGGLAFREVQDACNDAGRNRLEAERLHRIRGAALR